jgi:hypothetical protein
MFQVKVIIHLVLSRNLLIQFWTIRGSLFISYGLKTQPLATSISKNLELEQEKKYNNVSSIVNMGHVAEH